MLQNAQFEIEVLKQGLEFMLDPAKQEQEEREISELKAKLSMTFAFLPGSIEQIPILADNREDLIKCAQCGHEKSRDHMRVIKDSTSDGICNECFLYAGQE